MSAKKINLSMYKEYLQSAGCEVDEDSAHDPNHIWFAANGLNYLLSIDSDDDGFVEISLPFELDGNPAIAERYKVFDHIARTYKMVKCFYTKDGFIISAETFVRSSSDFKNFLKYCLTSLNVVYDDITDKFPDGV